MSDITAFYPTEATPRQTNPEVMEWLTDLVLRKPMVSLVTWRRDTGEVYTESGIASALIDWSVKPRKSAVFLTGATFTISGGTPLEQGNHTVPIPEITDTPADGDFMEVDPEVGLRWGNDKAGHWHALVVAATSPELIA